MTIELRWPNARTIASIGARPAHCERGRYWAYLELSGLFVSEADPWPRYYFLLSNALQEVTLYLHGREVNLQDARWLHVPLPLHPRMSERGMAVWQARNAQEAATFAAIDPSTYEGLMQ